MPETAADDIASATTETPATPAPDGDPVIEVAAADEPVEDSWTSADEPGSDRAVPNVVDPEVAAAVEAPPGDADVADGSAVDLDESGEPAIEPEPAPPTRVVVLFDEDAHAFREGIIAVDDVADFVRANRPTVYGVRDPVTGACELHPYCGDVKPAFEAAWATIIGQAPSAAAGDDVAIRLGALRDPPLDLAEPPEPASSAVDHLVGAAEHATAAGRYGLLSYSSTVQGIPPIDVAALAQGLAIAAHAARERRVQFPDSTPEASVVAVETVARDVKGLLHLLACYHHLAHAANEGADVSDQLKAVGRASAALRPAV